MSGLLLIAHAPLASAMKAVAEHTFPDCARRLQVLDVNPDMCQEDVETAARELMTQTPHDEWLILSDVFGATPHSGARRLLDTEGRLRLVSGLNAPMLWRTLCYIESTPLAALVDLAVEGGRAGIAVADIPSSPPPPESPESP